MQTYPLENKLHHYIRLRGDSTGKPVVFGWSGFVYAFLPEQRPQCLFAFQGFSVGKIQPDGKNTLLLTREAAFYLHPQTGKILEEWHNPFNGRTLPVIHIWNDPVNQLHSPTFNMPITELGETLCWHADILLHYPSPLPRAQYPQNSASDFYQGGEFFQFYVRRTDLENAALTSLPCELGWTRLSQWLPWMQMANTPGNLLFQCRGYKLPNGFTDLPQQIREYVQTHNPQFQHPPEHDSEDNETSWTYYRKLHPPATE